MEHETRSGWTFGLSLIEVMLLFVFAAMMVYVTGTVEGKGQDTQPVAEESKPPDVDLQAKLEAAAAKNDDLEKQLNEMTLMIEDVKTMVGAKAPTKEGLQVAVANLKRGYALCQQGGNTLIEASVQRGEETITVIGDVPPGLKVSLAKGDQTSDFEDIVSFLQDVYQYEKDQNCRFNYRLKYATDDDYKRAREGYDKYLHREK